MGTNSDFDSAYLDSVFVSQTLSNAGFVVNIEKSIWKPCQELVWLGLIWNSLNHSIQVPSQRLVDLITCINRVMDSLPFVSARILAGVTGRVISMSPVIGNVTRLMTRNLYRLIESRVSWDYNFILRDQEVIGELQFWKHEISALNLKCFSEYKVPSIIVYSDASSFACGAYSCQLDNQIFHKMWTGGEKELSSTWRELKAIELCIDTFQGQLSGKVLKWFTDSQNCVGIVESGSGKPQLHSLAMSIFSICVKNSINIDIEWIPRGKNIKADAISKIFDFDDWGVSLEFFEFIDSMYGPHSVDRFADSNNKKIELFNSRFYTPGSSGVDAFSFDWKEDNNWLVPLYI
ncbi:Hypothetical predicted protein [Mytilus galloprovincialis]|uniref:RNase H type-1 domain-containing protein n=1 Tax=Mytilus galloprovincialis TaxID=29158 RepID=A0A8B6D353_MYTGA|nr:Hypothetical predicted protein [Mytilus galloprovincialis]